jgi:hypothetical protein
MDGPAVAFDVTAVAVDVDSSIQRLNTGAAGDGCADDMGVAIDGDILVDGLDCDAVRAIRLDEAAVVADGDLDKPGDRSSASGIGSDQA